MQAETLKRDTGNYAKLGGESIESISAPQRTTPEVGGTCPARIAIDIVPQCSLTVGASGRPGMDSEEIKRRIVELQVEHRDLDDAIASLVQQPGMDELTLRRLKKRKLQIKDAIVQLQMQLVPDIPA